MNLMHSCTRTNVEIVHSPDLIPDVHILLGKVVCRFLRHAGITMLAAVLHIPRQKDVFLHQSAVCIRQQHCFNVHIVNSHICSLRGIHHTLCKYCTEQCSCRYPVRNGRVCWQNCLSTMSRDGYLASMPDLHHTGRNPAAALQRV